MRSALLYPVYPKGSTPPDSSVRLGGGTLGHTCLLPLLFVLENMLMKISNAREDSKHRRVSQTSPVREHSHHEM